MLSPFSSNCLTNSAATYPLAPVTQTDGRRIEEEDDADAADDVDDVDDEEDIAAAAAKPKGSRLQPNTMLCVSLCTPCCCSVQNACGRWRGVRLFVEMEVIIVSQSRLTFIIIITHTADLLA